MGVGRAEQDAVGHDDGVASAVFQQAQEKVRTGLLAPGRKELETNPET